MNSLKKFILLVSFLYITGCASIGPTIVIETEEPAEDFVVLCEWQSQSLFKGAHGGGTYRSDYKVIVTKSGKEVECGLSVGSEKSGLRILHPTLVGNKEQHYEKEGVKHLVYNKTKLDILDEQKAKFEAGYWDKLPVAGWDKDKTPTQRYARSIGGCGFGYQYLEYYSQAKEVSKQYFHNKYNDFFLKCNKKAYKEIFDKDASLKEQLLGVKDRMNSIWNAEEWRKYE